MAAPFAEFTPTALALPGPGNRDLGTVAPGFPRGVTSEADFVNGIINSGTKRFRSGDSFLGAFTKQLPNGLRVASSLSTGLSTIDQHPDEIITNTIIARPFGNGWEQGLTPYTALFSNKSEPDNMAKGMYTLADVPVLNYLLEQAAVAQQQASLLRADVAARTRNVMHRYKMYTATSAEEFCEKWNFLGNMTDGSGVAQLGPREHRAGQQRLLGYSNWKRAHTWNLFGEHLQRGQQLFFTIREFDMSPYKELYDPEGNSTASRAGLPSRVLQVRGFTDIETSFPANDTSCTSVGVYSATVGSTAPRDCDLDYIQRQRRLVCDYKPVDYDVLTDSWSYRDIAAQEGAQAALDDVPELVYDAYMTGICFSVGRVRDMKNRRVTQAQILLAQRSRPVMRQCGEVEIYAGIK